MKITQKTIADIARTTKSLPKNGLGETMHFYIEPNKELRVYEDISGLERYPNETGEYLLSATWPMTITEVKEQLKYNEKAYKEETEEMKRYQEEQERMFTEAQEAKQIWMEIAEELYQKEQEALLEEQDDFWKNH